MSRVIRRLTVLAECTKCSRLTNGASTFSFIAAKAASWHIEATSAPEHPSVYRSVSRIFAETETDQCRELLDVHSGLNCHFRKAYLEDVSPRSKIRWSYV